MAQCIDGKEFLDLNKRMNIPMEEFDQITLPESEVRTKLAKNKSWAVCKSYTDIKNKKFVYECAINPEKKETRTISFDEACNYYHWSKFEFINNGLTIKFTKDKAYLKEVPHIMSRASYNTKTHKYDKQLPVSDKDKTKKDNKDKVNQFDRPNPMVARN